jgi:dihydrodipicolinate reductase
MKFEVIGNHKVMGADKGEVIEIDNEVLAQTLIDGGHIKEVKRSRTKKGHYKADDPKTKKNEAYEDA